MRDSQELMKAMVLVKKILDDNTTTLSDDDPVRGIEECDYKFIVQDIHKMLLLNL